MRKQENPNSFQEKYFKIRETIRSKQIEEYKQKVRLKHTQEYTQMNSNINSNQYSSFNCSSKAKNIPNLLTNTYEHKNYLSELAQELHHLQQEYIHLNSNYNSETNSESEQLINLKELICEKYETFLHFWIQIEEANKTTGELHEKHIEILIHILKIVSELTKIGVMIWRDEQRECFSHLYAYFLYCVECSKNRSYLSFEEYIHSIELSADYIICLLAKSKANQEKEPNICHLFEFTELDEIIIMYIFDHILQIFDDVDYYSQIKIYIENKLTSSYFHKETSLGFQLKTLLNKLTHIQHQYLFSYLEEQSITHQKQFESFPEIGNITNGTIKSTLRLSLSTFFTQLLSISDWIDNTNNVSVIKAENIYEEIFEEANEIIQLFTQFCRTLDYVTNDFFEEFENSTSSDNTETILGMIFALCEGIIDCVGKIEEIEESSQFECSNKRYTSKEIFSIINHKDIVTCLTLFLSKRMYSEQFIYDIFSQSKMSIYILTCIFNQQTHLTNYHKNNRSSELRNEFFIQQPTLEMQCLIAVEAFLKNYGIKVDEEDNLQLRYLKASGDKNSSFYYEKLACTRNRMRI